MQYTDGNNAYTAAHVTRSCFHVISLGACACASACGTGAMTFGDMNNPEDPIVELSKNDRMYHLLEHIGTRPNVFYQVKVRNND